jgi:recombination protein RecA
MTERRRTRTPDNQPAEEPVLPPVENEQDEELQALAREATAQLQQMVQHKKTAKAEKAAKPKKEEKAPKQLSELEQTMAEIRKAKGENSILYATQLPLFNVVPTGSFLMDFATMGGVIEGLAAMRYGNENSGKTTMTLRAIAGSQRKHPDKKQVWIDREGTLDRNWAMMHGVDLNRLIISQPESGEEAVDVMEAMMNTWEISDVVLDSIPACVPKEVTDKSADDNTWAALAKLMGKMCSKILTSWIKERKRGHWVTVHLVNQFRSSMAMHGSPYSLPGGKQLNFLVTTKFRHSNKEFLGKDKFDNDVVDTTQIGFVLEKKKAGSIKSGEFHLVVNPDHPRGMGTVLEAATCATYAKRMDIITGGGASWKIQGVDQKFRTLADIEDFLYAEPDEFLKLKQLVIATQRVEKGLPALPPDGFLCDWKHSLPKELLTA